MSQSAKSARLPAAITPQSSKPKARAALRVVPESASAGVRPNKVQDMLALIKMTQYAERFPHELSGGQQQRIAIVRALACEPSLLLFDEAFSNIDPQFRFELIADIRALLKAQNIAALFVTHNQDEAFAFCDRIAVLNRGRIEQVGKAEALFRAPKTKFIAEFLGDGVWLSAQVQGGDLLSSELGSLTYRGEQDLTALAGKEVELYLRPHQLSLTADDKSHIRVEQERFVGGGYESILMFSDQHLRVHTQESFLNQAVAVRVNATVTCVFPKSA